LLRAFRVPIRLKWKFLIGILDLVLLFGGIHIYLVKMHLGKSLQEELHLRLKPLATSISNAAVPMLLRDERVELHKLLLDSTRKDPSVRYAAMIDRAGTVVSHTFGPGRIPENLVPANSLTPDGQEHYVRIQDARRLYQTYLDAAYPLGERGRFGTLRVGLDESGIRYTLTRIILSIVLMIILFVVLGIAGALILAWWVNRPIREIESAIRGFDLSSPVPTIDVQTGDELEGFGKSVESMMRRLKKNNEQMDILRTNLFRAERVAALGTLAAGISHEIRNPLAGLMNCLKRLSRNPDEANLQKYLPLMDSASRHIEETVSRYLLFSSAPPKESKPFCVNESAEIALALVRPRLESRAISVQVELEEGLPTVQGDPILLQQVLLNLLINAVDAIDREGTISLRTFRQNGNVVLVVGDTGSGIQKEDLDKLFDPFFTTKQGSGTGLGLTISKEIVKRLQGRIRVESESGEGTTFHIQLPANKG
jgi:two-component system NtrC family sensor kinase